MKVLLVYALVLVATMVVGFLSVTFLQGLFGDMAILAVLPVVVIGILIAERWKDKNYKKG